MTGVCRACGSTGRLGPDGACVWTAGCEHRQMQAEASTARIDAAMDAWTGAVGQLPEGVTLAFDLTPLISPAASHPYDDDLMAYFQRACEVHGRPVCVHCVARSN